mmetsp:Transcript_3397/g.13720  ORF Transcript_3397/g.13720 Transcript_3397/m.13720 type:complete len:223 (-) Transcript_3397:485-1153(-)
MSVAPVALEVANAVHKPRARAPEVAHHVERQPERQKREEKEGAVQDEHQSICEHIQVEPDGPALVPADPPALCLREQESACGIDAHDEEHRVLKRKEHVCARAAFEKVGDAQHHQRSVEHEQQRDKSPQPHGLPARQRPRAGVNVVDALLSQHLEALGKQAQRKCRKERGATEEACGTGRAQCARGGARSSSSRWLSGNTRGRIGSEGRGGRGGAGIVVWKH